MRGTKAALSIGLLAIAIGLSPAISFDGTRTPGDATVAVPLPGSPVNRSADDLGSATPLAPVPLPPGAIGPRQAAPSPYEAFRSGTQALRQGRTDQAIAELEYAAEQGVPGAIWKLGRMYADGDGVAKDKARAYEYFRRLTMMYGDDSSDVPHARFVANAFVTLGQYYLDGLPGVLYLFAEGAQQDAIQAARWLRLSAEKGDHRAQALLGEMLFRGDQISRQAARGLFWLILAKDSAGPDEGWITEMYSSAIAKANEGDRTLAHKYLEDWLKRRQ